MKYFVAFPTPSIEKKFYKALDSIDSKETRETILKSLESLADNPRPFGEPKIKPPIFVYHYTAQYRVKVGRYRILYDVDDKNKVVLVLDLRKRSERTYK
ncbi:MAG: type II toxin-antitoxin system RelE/ParE family toxin [Candidatus Omnitrophica bacterium]|nr:type II toxin-antitoxin system RelE/ParE family toxin [Candidatus Omnitrophota bacterium]